MKSNIWVVLSAVAITITYGLMNRYESHSFGNSGVAVVDKVSGSVKLCNGSGCYLVKDQ